MLKVVLKPPEGKGLFLELPYHLHNPQLDLFMSPCSVIEIKPCHCYYVYILRERRNSSSRHSFPDPCFTQVLLLQRMQECADRLLPITEDDFALEKNHLEKYWPRARSRGWVVKVMDLKNIGLGLPADFPHPGLWHWANHLVSLSLYFSPCKMSGIVAQVSQGSCQH